MNSTRLGASGIFPECGGLHASFQTNRLKKKRKESSTDLYHKDLQSMIGNNTWRNEVVTGDGRRRECQKSLLGFRLDHFTLLKPLQELCRRILGRLFHRYIELNCTEQYHHGQLQQRFGGNCFTRLTTGVSSDREWDMFHLRSVPLVSSPGCGFSYYPFGVGNQRQQNGNIACRFNWTNAMARLGRDGIRLVNCLDPCENAYFRHI